MIVYGYNVAEAILKNKNLCKKVRKIVIQDSLRAKFANLLPENAKFRVVYVRKCEIDFLAKGLHQGIMIDMDYSYCSLWDFLKKNPSSVVILDHLEDPHNFGAIIRTCEAAGVDYIVIPKNRSVSVNSTVMKTSVGALDNVKIVEVTNLNNTIKKLKDNGVWVVGTDLENSVSYDKIDYTTSIALIIGSEGFGMSNLVKKNCDFIANIPMYGKINSLNASVAAGIMIYEVVRQRK